VAVSARLGELADHLIGHFVDEARRAGASWTDIGESMGVTKQAAQKRFVPRVDDVLPSGGQLTRFTPRARQAFLLVAVEGFSLDEAATILDIDVEQLNQLLDQVSREIAEQMATDVLIIEDEPIIAMDIESLITGLGHNVTAIARTHNQAVEAVRRHRPGLVLADIQLADGSSGIDAVNEILKSFEVPVIFITAYPERLLTGERPEPAFLITKPFLPDMVKAVVSQALFFETRSKAPGSRQTA